MKKLPKITNIESKRASRLFTIEQVDLTFNNGKKRQYERIKGRTNYSVFVVPLLDENTILLGREYMVGVERYELGLIKGIMDPGESATMAANRELKEELGYGAQQLEELFTMSSSPGYVCSLFTVVFAWQLYPCKLAGDEPEPVEQVAWQFDKLDQLIEGKEISDARSIAALLRARQWFLAHRDKIVTERG